MDPNQNPVDPSAGGTPVNVPQPVAETPVVETPAETPVETPIPTTPVVEPTEGGTGDTGTPAPAGQ